MPKEMSHSIQEKLNSYLQARKALDEAHEALKATVIAESEYLIGDRFRLLESRDPSRVYEVTDHIFEVYRAGSDGYNFRPVLYPVKKDGKVASVGAEWIWYDTQVERVREQVGPTESEDTPAGAEQHVVVDGITRSTVKWPSRNKMSEVLRISNPYNLATILDDALYISFTPQQNGFLSRAAHYQVIRPGFETDPHGHFQDNGHKTFMIFSLSKEQALAAAMTWALERYGIDHWVRDAWGCWQRPEVYDAVKKAIKDAEIEKARKS